MTFGVLSLLRLKLNRETVPLFKGVKGKHFPERIPTTLVVLCFFNSLLKLLTPLILQETYSAISKPETDTREYFVLITVVICSIGLSQLLLIAYTLMLSVYRLNVKRELSARMLQNNFESYQAQLESSEISEKKSEFNMDLTIKINTKLAVYLHNYYDSYLSLIFECLNIIVIFIYLLYKLSFSLFFGIAIAGLVMYKSLTLARQINEIRFGNISLRSRRLKILQHFFNRITEFKMCWLDKWIYDRITNIEHQFQSGLRKVKMLDCWCVALWQFTSVGISSIVITAYFLLGLNQNLDKESVFTPSTFIYLLGMLNFPLNALSWYIAGMKTAYRAIEEIKMDISTESGSRMTANRIIEGEKSYIISEPLQLNLQQPKVVGIQEVKSIHLPKIELPKGNIFSVQGALAEAFLDKLVFLFEDKVKKGFVQENSWLSASPLETFRMQLNATSLQQDQKERILRLMELFKCADIPLSTNTKSYSGGQKLRISLVRAFNLGEIIVINTNLNSLDSKTQAIVKKSIRGLVKGIFSQFDKNYTVFLRDNEDLADYKLNFTEVTNNKITVNVHQTNLTFNPEKVKRIELSPEIERFVFQIDTAMALQKDKQSGKKKQYSAEKLQRIEELDKIEEKSVVSWSTFLLYYKSYKHLIFLVSLIVVSCLSNYYNYYVNTQIKLEEYNQKQVSNIILLTVLFAIGLFFRSFYFADANLDQSERICHNLNKNVIMNELSFYASEEIINEETSSIYSKSKMICALSSDTQTISDIFPFSTNIFANNITFILSSIVVIIVQVPPSIVLIVLLVIYANDLNRTSHKKDEYLQIAMKEKEVDVYRVLSQIENGKKYIVIHHKLKSYSKQLLKYQEEFNSVDWLSIKFKNYINLKYKIMMMLFLIVAVVFYSLFHIFDIFGEGNKENNSSSGLALLIQYTIQLSNNLLFFVMSIWEIKGQAVSLQRARPYLEQTHSIKGRIESANKIVKKLKQSSKSQCKFQVNAPLVVIENLDFAYKANPNQFIFKNMSLSINHGDRIMIRGRSGSGKTTLYKLLTSAYPKIINLVDQQFVVYFSPQHPLLLPDAETVQQNVDPYGVALAETKFEELLQRYHLEAKGLVRDLCYQQQIMINNIRAHLYGCKGIIIYDEPQIVIEQDTLTYLIVTHHHQFKHSLNMRLQNKTLVPRQHSAGIDQDQLLIQLN